MTDDPNSKLPHRFAGLAGSYFQRQGNDVTEQDASNRLGGLLNSWRDAHGKRDGVMLPGAGSALDDDEQRARPLPRSLRTEITKQHPLLYASPAHRADYAIGVYHNLMSGFDAMVFNDSRDTIRLHLSSEFVLIRALIEAASTAVWVLSPEDSSERLERTFRLLWEEVTYSGRLADGYARHADTVGQGEHAAQTEFVSGQKTDLETMAVRASVSVSGLRKGAAPSVVAHEAGSVVAGLGGALTFWYWSTASSIAHGEPTNTNMLADMSLLGVDARDRPVAHVEPSAVAVWQHIRIAHELIEQAHQLWNLRARARVKTDR
jgi:hypothetical protein